MHPRQSVPAMPSVLGGAPTDTTKGCSSPPMASNDMDIFLASSQQRNVVAQWDGKPAALGEQPLI
jgi:hypothetical protein